MPRKVKRTPIVPVVVEESEEDKSVSTEAIDSPGAIGTKVESAVEPAGTESAANDMAEAPRRPRKKLRRPTLSDTIPAIPVAAFQRLVREISEDCKSDMRWEAEALEALQVDTEAYLIGKFQKAKETLDLFGKSGRTVGDKMLRA